MRLQLMNPGNIQAIALEICRKLGLESDTTLIVRIEDGRLVLEKREHVVARAARAVGSDGFNRNQFGSIERQASDSSQKVEPVIVNQAFAKKLSSTSRIGRN
jgi:3-deoxy-D-arabino-heptulosonate 7-phosphate (DAHP) synthase